MSRSEILINLSERERRHFEFGQMTLSRLLEQVRPIINAAAKSNIRKPAEVAIFLNRSAIRTACGENWTQSLAKDLLSLMYEGAIRRPPIRTRPKLPPKIRSEAEQLTGKDLTRIKGRLKKKASKRLEAIQLANSRASTPSPPLVESKKKALVLSPADLKKNIAMLPSESAEALQNRWLNCLRNHLKPESEFPRAYLNALMDAINQEWKRRKLNTNSLSGDEWPTTHVGLTTSSILSADWPEEGILSFVGYRVGKTNPTRPKELRKLILEGIFLGEIPPIIPRNLLSDWGDPDTKKRLLKIANVLAALTRNAKRKRQADMSIAIGHWEDDLEYLRRKFWLPNFSAWGASSWPSA